MRGSGQYGPRVEVPDDADAQTRMLGSSAHSIGPGDDRVRTWRSHRSAGGSDLRWSCSCGPVGDDEDVPRRPGPCHSWPRDDDAGPLAGHPDRHQLAGVGAPRRPRRAGGAAQAQGLRHRAQGALRADQRAEGPAGLPRRRDPRRRPAVRRAVNRLLGEVGRVLDVDELPEVFVVNNPITNAMTIGMDKPIIVLNSALFDLLDEEEMRFVIAHELGHALSGHAVYRTLLLPADVADRRAGTRSRRRARLPGHHRGALRVVSASPSCPPTGPGCSPPRTRPPRSGCT